MYKIYKRYLDNMLDTIKSNGKRKMMLIRHYEAFEFYSNEDIMQHKEKNEIYIINHKFSYDIIDNPFEPFLGWIKEMVNANVKDIDAFLEEMKVYSMHKSIFKSYFKYDICCRYEELIDSSYIFEKKMMYNAIINMLKYFTSDKSALFMLDKFHCIELSTLKLLKKIIKEVDGIYILAAYNDCYPIRTYIKPEWGKTLYMFEESGFVVDYSSIYEESHEGVNEAVNEVEISTDWNLDTENIKRVMEIINNKIQFLAYEETIYYLETVYDKMNLEKIQIEDDNKIVIYEMFVKTLFILAKFNHENNFYTINDVLLICSKIKEIGKTRKEMYYNYIYKYNTAKVYTLNGQDKNSEKYANDAIKMAKKMREEVQNGGSINFWIDNFLDIYGRNLEEYVHMCEIYAEALLYKNINEQYLYIPDKNNVPEELISNLKKYEMYDHLAETLNHACAREKEAFKSVESMKEKAPMIHETMGIGEYIGNKTFLRLFYRANMMRASNAGYYKTADYFCEKVLEVVSDDEMQVAYTYMGRGYNCCTVEAYKEAHEYFCNALKICYKYHDVKHIAEIMYNLGLNALLAGYYEIATEYFNCALKIMDTLSISKLFACSRVKINALRIICYFRLNNEYLCNFEFKKIARNIDFKFYENEIHSKYIEEKFLYYYIKALLCADKEEYQAAEQNFGYAEDLLKQIEGVKFCYYTWLMADKINLLKETHRTADISKIKSEVIDFCDNNNYEHRKNVFLKMIENEDYEAEEYNFSLADITLNQIYEVAEIEKNKNFVEEKRNEEEFLIKWQNTMSNPGNDINIFMDKLLDLFIYNYSVDGIVMIRHNNDNLSTITKNMKNELPGENINSLWKFFDNSHKKEFFVTADDKNFDEYKEIIKLFESDKIYSVFGVPFRINNNLEYVFYAYSTIKSRLLALDNVKIYFMKEDNIDVYMRLFRQFIDGIDSMEKTIKINSMNQKLKYYAHTDMLTGLLNRKGLEEEITDILSDRSVEAKYRFYSIMYIDLDNFKYYNDTFGHEIGDVVLKRFANILQKLCEDSGIAARYGGDEFLVILCNMDKNKITEFANKIYEGIKDENYFVDAISEELNEFITIEPGYELSCSIGIANFKVIGEYGMNEYIKAVDNADKALYHVKKTTKGTFLFYSK